MRTVKRVGVQRNNFEKLCCAEICHFTVSIDTVEPQEHCEDLLRFDKRLSMELLCSRIGLLIQREIG